MSESLPPAAEGVLDAVKKFPGLSTHEYAEQVEKPEASVRRDLQILRARGLVRGEKCPDMAEIDGKPKQTVYWWVPIP